MWLGWDINNPGGHPNLPAWQEQTDYLKERLDEGLAANVMLSHDWNVVLSRISSEGFPTRAQNPDGAWHSKMGEGPVIEHPSPDSLSGGPYGNPTVFMRRVVSTTDGTLTS